MTDLTTPQPYSRPVEPLTFEPAVTEPREPQTSAPRPKRQRRRLAGRYAAIAVCIVIGVFPIYWMVASSLNSTSQFKFPPDYIPVHFTFSAYSSVFKDEPITRWFLNTLIVAVGTTFLSLLVGITAGLGLSRYPRTILGRTTGAAILVTQMLPAALLAIPIYIVFTRLHLVDNLPGLIVADTAFAAPLAIYMLKGFFDGIPRDIEEAAMVDGCSELRAYLTVTTPLATPGIVAVAIFSFMAAWDEFFFAKTLINSADNWVLSIGIASFNGEYSLKWSEMLAAATIFSIPPVIFFILAQRRMIAGLTGGAVKG